MRTICNRLGRTSRRAAILIAAVAVTMFALPSAAMAEDNYFNWCTRADTSCQTGVEVGLVEGECMTAPAAYHKTQVCIKYDGDYVYVYDGQADGYAAMAEIGNDNGSINSRLCRNNKGYGTWVRCNFDWAEAGEHRAWGGYKISTMEMPTEFLWAWNGK
ncbi:MAG: hypothetical protein HOQ43_03325 [Glycomyces artemisiae]|uniref:Peptidase inhibitor family I36 n=1 Tax=Glycomyces artemisiae TaxID=1076443 RepID=A0A850CAN9_9ACTN|nr:hypothetical protein [Glycomyces artemisiae]